MGVEHWLNNTDRVKSKYSEKNLAQCHSVDHKSYSTSEPGSLWWQVQDYQSQPSTYSGKS